MKGKTWGTVKFSCILHGEAFSSSSRDDSLGKVWSDLEELSCWQTGRL